MDIEQILLKEKRLIPIVHEAYSHSLEPLHQKEKYWYKVLKRKMSYFVGFDAANPEMSSTEVYDKMYRFLIAVLGV
jgi:hypothetical protein